LFMKFPSGRIEVSFVRRQLVVAAPAALPGQKARYVTVSLQVPAERFLPR